MEKQPKYILYSKGCSKPELIYELPEKKELKELIDHGNLLIRL